MLINLYQLCLKKSAEVKDELFFERNFFSTLPRDCQRDLLIYFTPKELECLHRSKQLNEMKTEELWRRHFQLIWSLSRDDKDVYDENGEIPYQRLFFEYLFHDTQILQLTIYTHLTILNRSISILDLSFVDHVKYHLSRDSIIYSSKRRLTSEQKNLLVPWNSEWNIYLKRFILVPNVWNLSRLDQDFVQCLTRHVTDLVLSGYPTENDLQGMRFILDVLTRGHIENLIVKFPSYCLMNILLPLFICPRSSSLSYLSDDDQSNPSTSDFNFSLIRRRRPQFCLHVQIDDDEINRNENRISQRLRPYLNRSRTSIRHTSISEPFVSTNLFHSESHSISDSHLMQTDSNSTSIPSPTSIKRPDPNRHLFFHLPTTMQTDSLTHLSIYYVSSIDTIEMIAIALRGMHQIHHLTLVNFALFSSALEQSLLDLCHRGQLESLHLTSLTLQHGAVGFLLHLFDERLDPLQRLHLDALKIASSSPIDLLHLIDVEQAKLSIRSTTLKHFIWRERHLQYIHLRLLYKLLSSVIKDLTRLELISILECHVFDQYLWCQTMIHHLSDVRLRNIRFRSLNLTRFFHSLNVDYHQLTIFHFERVGLTWLEPHLSSVTQAFTSLIISSKHLIELSLAYNNLNDQFIDWLCQRLMTFDTSSTSPTPSLTTVWTIQRLNLSFNFINQEAVRYLSRTLNDYTNRWNLRRGPIRRLELIGNALDMREVPSLKNEFYRLACDLIS